MGGYLITAIAVYLLEVKLAKKILVDKTFLLPKTGAGARRARAPGPRPCFIFRIIWKESL